MKKTIEEFEEQKGEYLIHTSIDYSVNEMTIYVYKNGGVVQEQTFEFDSHCASSEELEYLLEAREDATKYIAKQRKQQCEIDSLKRQLEQYDRGKYIRESNEDKTDNRVGPTKRYIGNSPGEWL